MTPQQKLVRLAEIERAIDPSLPAALQPPSAELSALQADRARILADVHLPPPELRNLVDPEAWAKAMSATVAGVSHETALAWLGEAMVAAGDVSQRAGYYAGMQAAELHQQDTRTGLIDAVRLVSDLIVRGQLRPPMVRDPNDPDNPPMTLLQHLHGVLRAAGQDVE